jgi:cytoskeleton protein RodZ
LTFEGSPGIVGGVTEDTARSLGEWLRQRREELDISLEQAEADIRIRIRYLEALEAEDFDALPDPVVGRGFLRNYAAYLDLDPLEASERYTALVAPPEPEPLPDEESSPFAPGPFRPVPLHDMPGWRPRRPWLLGVVVVVVVLLSLLAWWAYPYASGWLAAWGRNSEPAPTQRVTKAALSTATRTVAPTASVAPATVASGTTQALPTLELSPTPTLTPLASLTPSPLVYTGIFVELVLTDTSWVQVTADGVRQFQGELEADTYRSWYGEQRIELRVGNAGAVEVTINGQKLGALGAVGDVVDRVFEKVGEQVSEATPTRTVTGTVTVEPTAAPAAQSTVPPPPTVIAPTATITPTATPSPGP